MNKVEFHDLANLFPLIEGDDFNALVADIQEHGLLEKIVTFDGRILDGRNRFRALVLAGLVAETISLNTGMWFVEFNEQNFGADAMEAGPLAFVLSKNLSRRHLDEGQRSAVAARLANMRQGERTDLEPSANLPKVDQEAAARALHVSARSVRSAKAVLEHGTAELIAALEQGRIAVSQAEKAARLAPEQQREVAREAAAGRANVVRTVIKKGARDARETALGQKILALPDKQFGVILADPEWEFVVWSNITGLDRSALNHYETSPWEKISARDVQKIAAKDCVLFLWVTDLKRGIAVLESWGFEYKSYFVWVKDIVPFEPTPEQAKTGLGGDGMLLIEVGAAGTGYWNRDRDEILLVGTRGKVVAPSPGSQGESVWFAPRPKIDGTQRGRHSAKPEIAHQWIEQQYPNTPKIELNARKARPGWDVWGFEAPEGDSTQTRPGNDNAAEKAPAGDEYFARALRVVLTEKKASTSFIQRRLEIGYNLASRLVEQLEQAGYISAPDHRGARQILVTSPEGNAADEFNALIGRACAGEADAIAALPAAWAELLRQSSAASAEAPTGTDEPDTVAEQDGTSIPTPHRSASNAEIMAEAREIVIRERNGSASLLQRRLAHHHISYHDAVGILDLLEQQGVVSKMDERGAREVLIDPPAQEDKQKAAPPAAASPAVGEYEIPAFLRRPPVKLGGT